MRTDRVEKWTPGRAFRQTIHHLYSNILTCRQPTHRHQWHRKSEPSVEAYQAPLAFKGENDLRQISGWQDATKEDSAGTPGTQQKPVSSRKHQNCQFIETVWVFQITHANMNTDRCVWSVSYYETTYIYITCKNRTIKKLWFFVQIHFLRGVQVS